MTSWRARVITVSTRAAAGEYVDEAGPVAAHRLRLMGFDVDPVVVVSDGEPLALELDEAVASEVDLLITCGGTGISPSDKTPEYTATVIETLIPGIAEHIRAQSALATPTAVLSRGLAGLAGRTLVINLPGSTKAVDECMTVLGAVVPHALNQIAGGDHA